MSGSQKYTKKEKKERSIDQAYGQRGEEGGAKEGGEGRMPTPEENALGKALDDQAGVKEFMELFEDEGEDGELKPDSHLKYLRDFLPEDERKLFDLIFMEDIGSFGSDVKENMKQATALKDKYPDLYEKNKKRWSGFVGDLRKKLLDKIWEYIDKHMPMKEYNILKETFFGNVDPSYVRKKEKDKTGGKADYQQGIDERKFSKLKWQDQNGSMSPKDKASFESLKKNMSKRYPDLDLDAIPATENPQKDGWTLHNRRAAFSLVSISSRVAMTFSRGA